MQLENLREFAKRHQAPANPEQPREGGQGSGIAQTFAAQVLHVTTLIACCHPHPDACPYSECTAPAPTAQSRHRTPFPLCFWPLWNFRRLHPSQPSISLINLIAPWMHI